MRLLTQLGLQVLGAHLRSRRTGRVSRCGALALDERSLFINGVLDQPLIDHAMRRVPCLRQQRPSMGRRSLASVERPPVGRRTASHARALSPWASPQHTRKKPPMPPSLPTAAEVQALWPIPPSSKLAQSAVAPHRRHTTGRRPASDDESRPLISPCDQHRVRLRLCGAALGLRSAA